MSDRPATRNPYRGQTRLVRLQTVNWGTFHGYKDFHIDAGGMLFTGKSGSGKSSLLDGLSTIVLPTTDLHFNASADLSVKGAKSNGRTVMEYVRGAWAEGTDEAARVRSVRYLRTGTTWSAVGATFDNGDGQVTTAVALKWVTGSGTDGSALQHLYQIHESDFDLMPALQDDWAAREFSLDDLKRRQPGSYITRKQGQYLARLAARTGMGESAAARSLMGRAKAMKNVGDLDWFVRTNMLDRPDTFAECEQMLESFEPLDTAYETASRATQQLKVLDGLPEEWEKYRKADTEHDLVDELKGDPVTRYLRGLHLAAIDAETDRLGTELVELDGRMKTLNEQKESLHQRRQTLEGELSERGRGLRELENQLEQAERDATNRRQSRSLYRKAVARLGQPLPSHRSDFEDLRERLEEIAAAAKATKDDLEGEREEAFGRSGDLKTRLRERKDELEALQSAASLIGREDDHRRQRIASGTGIPIADLPYAAELIDLAPGEERWRGAAEKLLRNFGRRLLVPKDHREAVTAYIDQRDMRGIIEYSITRPVPEVDEAGPETLAGKLTVDADHPAASWVAAHLRDRFAHACVEDAVGLASHDLAVTVNGTVKRPGGHYRKDDRPEVVDPARYILGVNTISKRAALQEEIQQLVNEQTDASEAARGIDAAYQEAQRIITAASDVVAWEDWDSIDYDGALTAIADLKQQVAALESADTGLSELKRECGEVSRAADQAAGDLGHLEAVKKERIRTQQELNETFDALSKQPTDLEEPYRDYLDQAMTGEGLTMRHDNANQTSQSLRKALATAQKISAQARNDAYKQVQRAISEFLERWAEAAPDTSGDIDRAGEDFVELHDDIRERKLPEARRRLQQLIGNELLPSINLLLQAIEEASNEIQRKVTRVNSRLKRVHFDTERETYLDIAYTTNPSSAVDEFRRAVRELFHAESIADRDASDLDRFRRVRDLMAKFRDESTSGRQWRDSVLDVRLTYRFYGREITTEGETAQTYSNTAANSGGEQEKLVAFCLAAALSYNLADETTAGKPRFAPLMLDEAFSKSDETFSTDALNVFDEFGFQLIMAAPIRMSGIVEPFIEGALLVQRQRQRTRAGLHSHAGRASFDELARRTAEELDA